jgi:hypothetical protein
MIRILAYLVQFSRLAALERSRAAAVGLPRTSLTVCHALLLAQYIVKWINKNKIEK